MAAPHAFRQPAPGKAPASAPRSEARNAPASAPRPEARNAPARPVRVAAKAVVNGAPVGGDAEGWEEF
jgi:hypothetical protein